MKEIEEMQAAYDLQEQMVQSQTELIQALESEQICPSPFLKSAGAYLPRQASSMLESTSPTQEYFINNTNDALQPMSRMSEANSAEWAEVGAELVFEMAQVSTCCGGKVKKPSNMAKKRIRNSYIDRLRSCLTPKYMYLLFCNLGEPAIEPVYYFSR